MRYRRLYAHDPKGYLPRMSWAPKNLYSLISRSTQPSLAAETSFNKTSSTIYQQRWRAKRFIRSYHGNWVRERRFKRWFLPVSVPSIALGAKHKDTSNASGVLLPPNKTSGRGASSVSNLLSSSAAAAARHDERLPIASLFVRDVERRLDTVVFRSCLARSAFEARSMIIHGKVKLNGEQVREAGRLLEPNDLVTVDPSAIFMLSENFDRQVKEQRLARVATSSNAAEVEEQEKDEAAAAEEQDNLAEVQAAKEKTDDNIEGSEAQAPAEELQAEESKSSGRQDKGKGRAEPVDAARKASTDLPPGVRPFNLPPFAAPFLFVPGHLEVSYTVCSVIYLRHPTVTAVRPSQMRQGETSNAGRSPVSTVAYHTDIASPYPATGELFSMAWEHYTRSAPRTRSHVRRQQVEAETGRHGFASARAKDAWKKLRARRRGHTKGEPTYSPAMAAALPRSDLKAHTPAQHRRAKRQYIVGGRGASIKRGRILAQNIENSRSASLNTL